MNKSMPAGHQRAPQGGAFGANGEWYEGGKFINTVAANEKRAAKAAQKAIRRQEVEPYVWAVPPAVGQVALFGRLRVFGALQNGVVSVNEDIKPESLAYYGISRADVQAWVDAYNLGERWCESSA